MITKTSLQNYSLLIVLSFLLLEAASRRIVQLQQVDPPSSSPDSNPTVLLLPSPKWSLNFQSQEEDVSIFSILPNTPIKIKQYPVQDHTGTLVWDSSFVFIKYLEKQDVMRTSTRNVVELGSGTGFVGIAMHLLGANMTILTDMKTITPLIDENLRLNGLTAAPGVAVHDLDWLNTTSWGRNLTDALSVVNTIVAVDCIWLQHLIQPLVTSIMQIVGTSQQRHVDIFIVNELRSIAIENRFAAQLRTTLDDKKLAEPEVDVSWQTIPPSEMHEQFSSNKIQIAKVSITRAGNL